MSVGFPPSTYPLLYIYSADGVGVDGSDGVSESPDSNCNALIFSAYYILQTKFLGAIKHSCTGFSLIYGSSKGFHATISVKGNLTWLYLLSLCHVSCPSKYAESEIR